MYQLFIDNQGDYLIMYKRTHNSWYRNYPIEKTFALLEKLTDKRTMQQLYQKYRPKFICKFESLEQLKTTHPELFI